MVQSTEQTNGMARERFHVDGTLWRNVNWNYISFQEVSQNSGIYSNYEMSLPKLINYTKGLATKLILNISYTKLGLVQNQYIFAIYEIYSCYK